MTAGSDPIVSTRREGGIAIVTICNPPVNALSRAVRKALLETFDALGRDDAVFAIVLTGANDIFVAGADISELDAPPQAPALREVVQAVEDCPKPVVALIEGASIGGGLELALACDKRIGTSRAVFAMPEVKLGMIPGAGGTQRLPRLIGRPAALSLISTGRTIKAPEAVEIGLLDGIADDVGMTCAMGLAAGLNGAKCRARERTLAVEQEGQWAAALARAAKSGHGGSAVAEATRVIGVTAEMSFAQGVELEKEAFLALRDSDAAKALRYLFFAERKAAKVEGTKAEARRIQTVGIVGGGYMGSGIAAAMLSSGINVVLVECDAAARDRARALVEDIQNRDLRSGRIDEAEVERQRLRFAADIQMSALSGVDLCIEAVVEDMAVKVDIFRQLGDVCDPQAILASNTSFLDIDQLADASGRPERVLGLHFFGPANRMRLLEIVRGQRTASEVLATALAVAKRIGKQPVVSGVCDGFIANRIMQVYRQQCEFMLEEGAFPDAVDAAMEAFGFPMGPFAVVDMAGLDISWARRKRLAPMRDSALRYSRLADQLCEEGRFGRKTKAGWYRYDGAGTRLADPAVEAMITATSQLNKMTRMSFSAEQIQFRALAALLNEAALVLEEGIAQRPSDIDVAITSGFGFPREKGGPLYWAAHQPEDAIQDALAKVAQASGPAFRRAGNIPDILRSLQIFRG
ncbi:MAG: enoyl-CoA hydratase/isomerase family protein [Sphingorhabdus sp.]|nr:enoyl-CoA hydratase/isomerase family protein [Sphingorhabdus sp.]